MGNEYILLCINNTPDGVMSTSERMRPLKDSALITQILDKQNTVLVKQGNHNLSMSEINRDYTVL